MTDRAKITAVVATLTDHYSERDYSLTIHDSGIKIMWREDGSIKSVIRGGRSYHAEEE